MQVWPKYKFHKTLKLPTTTPPRLHTVCSFGLGKNATGLGILMQGVLDIFPPIFIIKRYLLSVSEKQESPVGINSLAFPSTPHFSLENHNFPILRLSNLGRVDSEGAHSPGGASQITTSLWSQGLFQEWVQDPGKPLRVLSGRLLVLQRDYYPCRGEITIHVREMPKKP